MYSRDSSRLKSCVKTINEDSRSIKKLSIVSRDESRLYREDYRHKKGSAPTEIFRLGTEPLT